MPLARAELLSTLEQSRHDICAAWKAVATVSLLAYVCFVPISAILARQVFDLELLLVLPGAVLILFTPLLLTYVGVAHARFVIRRNLRSVMATVAKKHGVSLVELEPVVRPEVSAIIDSDPSPRSTDSS